MKKGNILLVILVLICVVTASVGGYFWWTSQKPKVESAQETKSNDEIKNWNTYENLNYGFSLRYPEKWSSKRGEKTIVITPAPESEIGYQIDAVNIHIENNQNHLTSREYYNNFIKKAQEGSVCTNPLINNNVPISLKNLDVTIIEGTYGVLSQGPRMVVATEKYIVDISSSFVGKIDSNLIYQILSTFKFIDQDSEGSFCGGIAGISCADGYRCQLDRNGPDASGRCKKFGGIYGKATRNSAPYVGKVFIGKQIGPVKGGSYEDVANFQTNNDGSFRAYLPPGDFVAKGLVSDSNWQISKSQIHIVGSEFIEVDINFDTGIR